MNSMNEKDLEKASTSAMNRVSEIASDLSEKAKEPRFGNRFRPLGEGKGCKVAGQGVDGREGRPAVSHAKEAG
jgi:hypothetical protein